MTPPDTGRPEAGGEQAGGERAGGERAGGPPWVRVDVADPARDRRRLRPGADGLEVRVLDGGRMATASGLFAQFARGWDFPDYFGHNWSALEDCLVDLAWAPAAGRLCVIRRAEELLVDEPPAVLALLADLLERVGRHWAAPVTLGEAWDRPAAPFHTLLLASTPRRARVLRDRLDAAGHARPGQPSAST